LRVKREVAYPAKKATPQNLAAENDLARTEVEGKY
jgi:hypothetical protein